MSESQTEAVAPKLSAVRAKMRVTTIETNQYSEKHPPQHKVRFGVVCGDQGEDRSFSEATPSGECWLTITHGYPALDFFKPDRRYHVTFTEAP